MPERLPSYSSQRGGPAGGCFSITAGASPLKFTTTGIYVGGAGDLTITDSDGVSTTFVGVPGGTILPIAVTHVTAATATNLVGLA